MAGTTERMQDLMRHASWMGHKLTAERMRTAPDGIRYPARKCTSCDRVLFMEGPTRGSAFDHACEKARGPVLHFR